MKIHSNINQQKTNTAFRAYYVENSQGHLKNLYNKTKNFNKLEESIKLLKEKQPNQPLEILEAKFFRGTEENPKVDWREATRSMWGYLVRNNENGRSIWVCTPAYYDHLTQLSENLARFSDDVLWRSKKDDEELYKTLVTPNNKVINIAQEPKKMSIIDKIKDFAAFWTTVLSKNN